MGGVQIIDQHIMISGNYVDREVLNIDDFCSGKVACDQDIF